MLKPCPSISRRVIAAGGLVELRGAVARFVEQHDMMIRVPVEASREVGIVERRERLGRFGDQLRQAPRLRPSRHVRACGSGAIFGPSLLSDQRHEEHRSEPLLLPSL
jgi:hypothetical protein